MITHDCQRCYGPVSFVLTCNTCKRSICCNCCAIGTDAVRDGAAFFDEGCFCYQCQTVTNFYSQLLSRQQSLGKEFEQVLHDNLWDLLVCT